MSLAVTNRLTSKDVRIEFTPCALAPATHDEAFQFHLDIASGTFKLRVNGELTSAITFDETTPGDTATAIQAALDALANLSSSEIGVTGSDTNADTDHDSFRFLAAGNGFYRIVVEADALVGNTSTDANIVRTITVQGSETYVLSGELTQFSYEESTDTVDVTAISELEATEIAVKSSMSFDATIYDANEDFTLFALKSGENGLYTVYKEGKVLGKEVFAFTGLAESIGKELPDHEKIEISLSGMRQGAMSIPFGSIYRG